MIREIRKWEARGLWDCTGEGAVAVAVAVAGGVRIHYFTQDGEATLLDTSIIRIWSVTALAYSLERTKLSFVQLISVLQYRLSCSSLLSP
jgi:hypothetical protein